MVDSFLSKDLLRALDTFISDQHPDLTRYDALRLAFHDWAVEHGYLDTPLNEADVFPRGRRDSVPKQDRRTAGEMLNRFIHEKRRDEPSRE